MEIMRTLTSSLGKVYGAACCLLLCTASGVLASDVVLQRVPLTTVQAPANPAQSRLGPQATFALINYNLRDARAKARALYVSSGNDLSLANSMIDDQVATSFGFSAEDKSPTAVIDLGKVCTVRRLSAIYSPRPGSIDFYVMQSLPGTDRDNSASTVKLDSNALASLKRVGSVIDDGTRGRASIDFPATSGRYVMLRWIPAAHADTSFTVAEVAAFSAGGRVQPSASSAHLRPVEYSPLPAPARPSPSSLSPGGSGPSGPQRWGRITFPRGSPRGRDVHCAALDRGLNGRATSCPASATPATASSGTGRRD